jgi:hypothetical protein
MRTGLAIAALLVTSALSLPLAHADSVRIEGDSDAALKEAMEKFYMSVLNTDAIKKVNVDLLVTKNGLKMLTIDGKPGQTVCGATPRRLDDVRSIKTKFQSSVNVVHDLEISVPANDAARAWTDVACVQVNGDPALLIRGTFASKGFSPRIQMYDLRLVSVAP